MAGIDRDNSTQGARARQGLIPQETLRQRQAKAEAAKSQETTPGANIGYEKAGALPAEQRNAALNSELGRIMFPGEKMSLKKMDQVNEMRQSMTEDELASFRGAENREQVFDIANKILTRKGVLKAEEPEGAIPEAVILDSERADEDAEEEPSDALLEAKIRATKMQVFNAKEKGLKVPKKEQLLKELELKRASRQNTKYTE